MRITALRRRRLAAVACAAAVLAGTAHSSAGAAAPAPPWPVVAAMDLADKYWIAHGPDQAANTWQNAAFNAGNLAYVRTTGVANHYTLPWARANGFAVPADPAAPLSPDGEAAGEVYLELSA